MDIQQFLHRCSLVISDLKIHMSSRRQMFGTFFCQNSVKIKPVRGPVKSSPWLMVPHFRFQLFDNCAGDVGWVGDDHIERFCLRKSAEHVTVAEAHTRIQHHTLFRIVILLLMTRRHQTILFRDGLVLFKRISQRFRMFFEDLCCIFSCNLQRFL